MQVAERLTHWSKSQEPGDCSALHSGQLVSPDRFPQKQRDRSPRGTPLGLAAPQSCQQPGGPAATLPPEPGRVTPGGQVWVPLVRDKGTASGVCRVQGYIQERDHGGLGVQLA